MSSKSFQSLLQQMSTRFRPLGYKKKKNFLVKEGPNGNYGYITFIKERSPQEADSVRFTVEVSGASRRLLDRFRKDLFYAPSGTEDPRDNHFSERIGYLLGYGRDYWWTISPLNELSVVEEVVRLVSEVAPKYIEENISDESICKGRLLDFNEGNHTNPTALLWLAYLLKELGDEENFKRVAKVAHQKFGDRPFEAVSTTKFLESMGFSV